jgi:hypothetical protein
MDSARRLAGRAGIESVLFHPVQRVKTALFFLAGMNGMNVNEKLTSVFCLAEARAGQAQGLPHLCL